MSKSNTPLTDLYGKKANSLQEVAGYGQLKSMLQRGSCRSFSRENVDPDVIRLLCAAALASPTKSDLQQRDIVIVDEPALKAQVIDLLSPQKWMVDAPCLLVFCGNNRRQRRLHELRNLPFENDHLDAFFNASVDAGVALSAFVIAAEALGLGCCPISAIRNRPDEVSDLLGLPNHVFPVAGLAVGHPVTDAPRISPRLPLGATVHTNRYDETQIDSVIENYDARRNTVQPYESQRGEDRFGVSSSYGWSEDKARQYALPERQDFGQFIVGKGFKLS